LQKPWAKGLVNACLRASVREQARVEQALAASAELRYSHPAWLIAALRGTYPEKSRDVVSANNERPPLTLRVNRARMARADYQAFLRAHALRARPHPRADSALVLDEAVPVDRLPGFGDGLVSVQDAGAQLAAIWLDTRPHQRVLDACAAPGGKTAHILERTPALKELTALDIDPARLDRVRATLARLGLDARLLVADAAQPSRWWDGRLYDRVLVDAPCSATGVIRRHPDIKVRRQPQELALLVRTQAEILDGVWPCLAPGGKLLYATCSVLSEENELQVGEFLRRHPDAVAQPLAPSAKPIGRQILPGEEEMDGFYYACFAKT
jgi:16S rRNA (cytosine967-C5)-methyltransferase